MKQDITIFCSMKTTSFNENLKKHLINSMRYLGSLLITEIGKYVYINRYFDQYSKSMILQIVQQ